jgi:glycolate oxidase
MTILETAIPEEITVDARIVRELVEIVGVENVFTSPEDLVSYSFDGTFAEHRPDAVVQPATTEEVSRVLALANREDIPVVPRGMASGLAAASIPFGGGLALSLTRMNRILEIDRENMTATAEPGVITAHLQAEVEKLGMFYPPDPSSVRQSTLGGNVACNAGGPRCLKYGITGDYVLGLTVVLADGRALKTGGKSIKNVTGYNLTQLFIGSEGTLGVITEILVKLVSKPQHVRTALAIFDRLDDASETVNAVLMTGIVPATLELMDETAIACIEEATGLGLPLDKEAILIIECDGNDEGTVLREIDGVAQICREKGAADVQVARDEAQRDQLWQARRSVSPSLARQAPNKLGEDISVPRSQITEAVRRIKEISRRYDLPIVVFGHAGDGNLHPNVLFDMRDADQWARVQKVVDEIFAMAVELGGTLSGEHGVGVLKRAYMEDALGADSLDVQRRIKEALDPKGILCPGKVLPQTAGLAV